MKIVLKKPANCQVVSQTTEAQQTFMETAGKRDAGQNLKIDWLNLVKQGDDNTNPAPVSFCWSADFNEYNGFETWLELSADQNFQTKKTFRGCSGTVKVYSLLLGQTYYWRVFALKNGETVCVSDTYCFTTALTPPRWIGAEGLSNVRDIGGWPLPGGKRIRQGLVFRGCEMEFHHIITASGKNTLLHDLNMKTDLDLRGEAVGKVTCSALGPDIHFCLIPVKAYDEFMADSEKDVCRKVFRLFTDKKNYPFYIHCWGGADRTGTLIFLLCAILGMAENDLYLDYELTSLSIWGERSRNSELFQAFLKALDAYPGDTLNQKSENFLLSAGITEQELKTIRSILTED